MGFFRVFGRIKTACPPFKNGCTGILERRLFQNDRSPTAPSGTKYIFRPEALIKLALIGLAPGVGPQRGPGKKNACLSLPC